MGPQVDDQYHFVSSLHVSVPAGPVMVVPHRLAGYSQSSPAVTQADCAGDGSHGAVVEVGAALDVVVDAVAGVVVLGGTEVAVCGTDFVDRPALVGGLVGFGAAAVVVVDLTAVVVLGDPDLAVELQPPNTSAAAMQPASHHGTRIEAPPVSLG